MSYKIGSDVGRFKEIVRGKVKSDLKRFVSSQDLLGQQGGKTVRIPISNIDTPRFTYGGGKGSGGAGMGDGNPGDPMGGEPKPGDGKGKAGNEKGDHAFGMEFSAEEIASLLGEELELPDIAEKNKGKIGSAKSKYNNIHRLGTEGLRHFKRTYKQALIRSISSGTYNPANPMIIPIKDDKRYKASSTVPEPDVNAVIIYLIDVSGSMTDDARLIAQSEAFWIDAWLNLQYKGLETRFLIHDTEATEVDRKQFFSINSSGGTSIASGYELVSHLIETEYPFSDYNTYVVEFSDGDNWSEDDSQRCISLLKEKILPNCNLFCYEQITTNGSGEFYNILEGYFPSEEKLLLHKIANKDEILLSLKFFLGKGA